MGEGRGERRSDKLARAGTEHQIHVRLAKCALMIVTSVGPAGFPALKRTRRSSCAALCATSLRSVTSMRGLSRPAFVKINLAPSRDFRIVFNVHLSVDSNA